MQIELFGGPADGTLMVVPDDALVWVVRSPVMSTAEFLALEHSDPSTPIPRPVDVGYQITTEKNFRNGARIAKYVGERAKA